MAVEHTRPAAWQAKTEMANAIEFGEKIRTEELGVRWAWWVRPEAN